MKLCECGCGRPTLPYTKNDKRIGAVKGEYAKRIKGHSYHNNPAFFPKPLVIPATKRCPKCKAELPYTDEFFHPSKNYLSGLAATCKTCTLARNKRWRDSHPEQCKKLTKDWHAAHREEVLQYYRNWKLQHPEYSPANVAKEWREANDARYRESLRRWRKDNPEKARAAVILYKHKRRAASDETITAAQLLEHFVTFNGLCGICDSPVSIDRANWDHIEPISKGGKHALSNLHPVHRLCNSIKGARTLEHARNRVAELRQTGKFKEQ